MPPLPVAQWLPQPPSKINGSFHAVKAFRAACVALDWGP
jgi:hypothetical protein